MTRIALLLSAFALAGCAEGVGLFNSGGTTAAPAPAANPNATPNAAPNATAATNTPAPAPNPPVASAPPRATTPPPPPTTTATVTPPPPPPSTTTTTPTPPPETEIALAPPPPADATTAEELDTTTEEERAVASAPPPASTDAGDGRLGTTVASIGAADEPGFWIKTPLVNNNASGRLFYPASGRTVQVQLIPSGGSSGSGSQVSLAALRLLDAPLDGLPELVVYEN